MDKQIETDEYINNGTLLRNFYQLFGSVFQTFLEEIFSEYSESACEQAPTSFLATFFKLLA